MPITFLRNRILEPDQKGSRSARRNASEGVAGSTLERAIRRNEVDEPFSAGFQKEDHLSLDPDNPSDKAILDFLSGLPRRTRSEIIKEILLDALEKKDDRREPNSQTSDIVSGPDVIDPEEIIEKLF